MCPRPASNPSHRPRRSARSITRATGQAQATRTSLWQIPACFASEFLVSGVMSEVVEVAPQHEERIASLLALEPNWNSYRAPAIDPKCVERARPFINRLQELGLSPWITPTNSGGVHLERASKNDDYGIEFEPGGTCAIYFEGMSMDAAKALLETASQFLPR